MSFEYRGLKADFKRHMVCGHEVEHQLEHIAAENPKMEIVTDRPAQLGDEVIIDYAGFCDGEQFQGGTAEKQPLTLGSGMFIPGFEDQLVGKEIGEEVSVFVTFPEAYHSEKLSGKPAEFKCKIHEIHAKSKYEFNDDFAKEFGGVETMEEFRQLLKDSMQKYADDKEEMELQQELLVMAAKTLDYEPTAEEIEDELKRQMEKISEELAYQGMSLGMYCQFAGVSEDQMKAEIRQHAVITLKENATVKKIAELENVTASESEIEDALAIVARGNHIPLEQLKTIYDEKMKEDLSNSIIFGKVLRLIRDAAEITEICEHNHEHGHHCHCH